MPSKGRRSNCKRKPGIKRCLAVKDDGKICGTILNSYHYDNICFACRHRVAFELTEPKLAELEDYLKQKGANHGE